ncbi:beta-ketoacyl synthase chain length factor [Arenimonas fontis]|uniref:Beta-ketoacyl synthase chain length factor n=1 Tax=Arenimonas fontis TaxID=2608255 RepID=A0A5B2ZFR2_9GAMM|nr:beta-ketoacyl synthase chain length factor [Arenimonas fontis]KAA2285942.1 beta-ketoacyl synthase chain length factor [Arenimonas fontis]
MPGRFSIETWSACAAGIEDRQAWQAWARAPFLPEGEPVPALAEMPAMQRRRLGTLGRLALQVAWRCQPEAEAGLPMVFASRHGDIHRTQEMLDGLARGEPLSPTQFGLSTHNAIAAQYSIARGMTGNYLAVAAGEASVEAGVVEALGLLADGAPAVLLVAYDAPIPSAYEAFRDEPECSWAWAWRLVPPGEGLPTLSLSPAGDPAPAPSPEAASLPHGLEVLRQLLAGGAAWPSRDRRWVWRRHA